MRDIVDDVSSRIVYAGSWSALKGSTRQWGEGTFHSTAQREATASFSFRGNTLKIYATIPPGTATSAADIQIDGRAPVRINVASGSQSVYNYIFYDAGILSYGEHTIIITNRGQDEFRLDRISYDCESIDINNQPQPPVPLSFAPAPPPPPPASQSQTRPTLDLFLGNGDSSSSGSSSVPTPTQLPASGRPDRVITETVIVPSVTQDTSIVFSHLPAPNSQSQALNIGAIAGIIISALFLILAAAFLFFYVRCNNRRRHHSVEGGRGSTAGSISFWRHRDNRNEARPNPYNFPPQDSSSVSAGYPFAMANTTDQKMRMKEKYHEMERTRQPPTPPETTDPSTHTTSHQTRISGIDVAPPEYGAMFGPGSVPPSANNTGWSPRRAHYLSGDTMIGTPPANLGHSGTQFQNAGS